MTNEEKKNIKEKNSIERVIYCRTVKGDFAKNMHDILADRKEFIDCSGERPDIIIESDIELVGIEHCQVDLLFNLKKKKAQSMIRTQESKTNRLIEKYKDKELLDTDIKNGTALKSVLDLVEERITTRNRFDYVAFKDNFSRVCLDHNDNCTEYRERLKSIANDKLVSLGCLVEIPYSKETEYHITDIKGTRKQAIKGIPITFDMLFTIQKMNGFDFVILCMYCINNPNDCKNTVCYYFSTRNIPEGIKQQRIKPVISFDFIEKPDVRFPFEEYKRDEDSITFTAEASFQKKK